MITDFETWISDVGKSRIFRILEYRRPGDWTPLEMEEKYIDQSEYKDDTYQHAKIIETIQLPDGDILIGFQFIYDLEDIGKDSYCIDYRKLSQVELMYNPDDMDIENWE